MGRPRKEKLDYFQLDTDIFEDLTIRKLIRRCGGEAVLVYIAFLQQIYKSKNGYYFEVDEDTAFIVAEQISFEEEYIKKALDECVSLGLFDAKLYRENNILTSASVQERYCFIRKRKVSDLRNYCIISDSCFEEKTEVLEEKPIVSEKKLDGNQSLSCENSGFSLKNGHNNNIYNNSNKNKKEINKEKDLPAADAPVSGACAPDPPESETKTDFKSLMAFVNAEFAKGKSTMPRLRTIDGTRRAHTLARIREHGEDALREVVRKAVASDFLNGNNSRGWAATFDWLVLPNNFIKVLEGNYDNDRHNKQNGKFNAGLDPRFNFETDGRDAKAELYPDVL